MSCRLHFDMNWGISSASGFLHDLFCSRLVHVLAGGVRHCKLGTFIGDLAYCMDVSIDYLRFCSDCA